MSDKTQVWPMDQNDGVRTRLTHSHEVANLARSIGARIGKCKVGVYGEADVYETVQPILLAIGLAHDLGNPPFGHQGETAIGRWFKERKKWIFTQTAGAEDAAALEAAVPGDLRDEFLEFDGNPQSFRLLTKLQPSVAYVGLDLTAATLAASLKYPVCASSRNRSKPAIKKVGYFESERDVIQWIRELTGLAEGERHPLTWIMEASDDIAYSVLDVEDAIKKGMVSPEDIVAVLKSRTEFSDLVQKIEASFSKIAPDRAPEVTRDIKSAYLKAHFFDLLVEEAADSYLSNSETIGSRSHEMPLMECSTLCNRLKDCAKQYAFGNSSVLQIEAMGAVAIRDLLDEFWDAIRCREKLEDLKSRRTSARAAYVFSLISPNYLENATIAPESAGPSTGIRYRELRLLTDMISGMTDRFAIDLWMELKSLRT